LRVGFPGGPRLEWYDRNPLKHSDSYDSGSIAPHVLTIRMSYTVPTGKKAFLESCLAKAIRRTVATTESTVLSAIKARGHRLLLAWLMTNNVGDADSQVIGQSVTLNAGEAVLGETLDQSTGGTCNYYLAIHATEFDA